MSNAIPESVTRLTEAFSRLPGIGPKTAARLTYHLLRAPDELSVTLAQAIADLKTKTRLCSVCYNITEADPCPVCQDLSRDRSVIAVVEEPLDVLALERINTFKGCYHVLHGVISPREGIFQEQLKIKELVQRVEKSDIKEVIICTNPRFEGDITAKTIQQELGRISADHPVKVTVPARGLATGADLEYADSVTLIRAIEGRREF